MVTLGVISKSYEYRYMYMWASFPPVSLVTSGLPVYTRTKQEYKPSPTLLKTYMSLIKVLSNMHRRTLKDIKMLSGLRYALLFYYVFLYHQSVLFSGIKKCQENFNILLKLQVVTHPIRHREYF